MLELKLNHVSKRGHWTLRQVDNFHELLRYHCIVCLLSVTFSVHVRCYNIHSMIQFMVFCFITSNYNYNDVIMGTMASPIASLTIVNSTIYSGANQRKHQSSASLAFVRGIHRWPVNSPDKGPVTRKIFPFDDVIMFDCPGASEVTLHATYCMFIYFLKI